MRKLPLCRSCAARTREKVRAVARLLPEGGVCVLTPTLPGNLHCFTSVNEARLFIKKNGGKVIKNVSS